MPKIPLEISARHIHLSQKDLEKLFGRGYKLKKLKDLSQRGQFACQETVGIKTGKFEFSKVRVLGPVRGETQVEVSMTEARKLAIEPPVRTSGDLKGSAGIKIIGPVGEVKLKQGVIIARRHIHASPREARKYKLKDGQKVSVKVKGERGLTFHEVVVRMGEDFSWRMQVDTDEGNAAGIRGVGEGELIIW